MNVTIQNKITFAVVLIAVAALGGAFLYQALNSSEPADAAERETITVRDNSHRLDTVEDGKVTLVEFLDFECEACGAAYPFVEQLREQYQGRVTFVTRYFPIPSHRNAENAAYAVESAARQDKFEEMYKRMFDTQAQWGESQDSKASLFRSYAEELGLDMAKYDSDVKSESVAARVRQDVVDGTSLGISGTPTFFLNGERLEPTSDEDFTDAIDAALAE